MVATKINPQKLACTINANEVRGRSYNNLFTRKIIQKFLYTKISRSTVCDMVINSSQMEH